MYNSFIGEFYLRFKLVGQRNRVKLKVRYYRMNIKIIISAVIVYLVGSFFAPFDPLSSLVYGIESVFLCCVTLLILSRRKFVKSSSSSMHTLVCVLICIISVLLVCWINFGGYKYLYPSSSGGSSSSYSSGSGIKFGNLWVGYSSDPDTECVVFSVDDPNSIKHSSPTNNWKLTFLDNSSVEFNIIKDETVWVDEKHRVTFLGPVLNKEDVSFIESLRHDKELKISSPDELLEIINKLKAEHKISASSS